VTDIYDELLPCPFCGSDGFVHFHEGDNGPDWWSVDCTECSCSIGYEWDVNEAIRLWNTRVTPQPETSLDDDGVEWPSFFVSAVFKKPDGGEVIYPVPRYLAEKNPEQHQAWVDRGDPAAFHPNENEHQAIFAYEKVVSQYGPDSPEAQEFRRNYPGESFFVGSADAIDRSHRAVTPV
jgi:hypothetical protein